MIELLVYTGLHISVYYHPALARSFPEEKNYLINNITGFWLVGVSLALTMYAQIRLYRRQQERITKQNALLEEVSRSKTRFLANASHEMRTPLTVISVDIQTVMAILEHGEETAESAEAQHYLRDAQEEIMRLGRMVSGMLALNAGAEGSGKTKTAFSELLINTAEMLRLIVGKKGNTLTLQIEENLTVFANADLISQVVVNLIQNANQHTKEGDIYLTAKTTGLGVEVAVTDTGSGISKELLPHIFERGVTEGGTGVGLHLCKTIVESHGGEIGAVSREGEGTSVTFTLPPYQGQV